MSYTYVNIRRATDTPKDVEILKSLDKACFPDDHLENFAENDTNWIALDSNDQPVGFASVRQSCWSECGYISRYGVTAAARGKGLGKKLIRVMERYGRTRGWTALITYTATWNYASANAFIGLGYKMYAPGYAWAGWKEVIYWFKKLTKEVETVQVETPKVLN